MMRGTRKKAVWTILLIFTALLVFGVLGIVFRAKGNNYEAYADGGPFYEGDDGGASSQHEHQSDLWGAVVRAMHLSENSTPCGMGSETIVGKRLLNTDTLHEARNFVFVDTTAEFEGEMEAAGVDFVPFSGVRAVRATWFDVTLRNGVFVNEQVCEALKRSSNELYKSWSDRCNAVSLEHEKVKEVLPFLMVGWNAHVSGLGNVFDCEDAIKEARTCGFNIEDKDMKSSQSLEVVYTLAQHWGEGYFHFMLECLPRLMIFYEQLLAHPEIRIHIKSLKSPAVAVLEFLGFPRDRIVAGPQGARSVIYPQRCGCGNTCLLLVLKARRVIKRRLFALHEQAVPDIVSKDEWKQPRILVVRRRKSRSSSNFDSFLDELRRSLPQASVTVFDEASMPSIADGMQIFRNAVLMIGPHGAGLSNALAMRHGAAVLEFLVFDPINMCYYDTIRKMGLDYYGFMNKDAAERDIRLDIPEILVAVRRIVEDHLT